VLNVENQIRAAALKARPVELNTRLPYASKSFPQMGLNTRIIISIGISPATPVLKAV